jgi:hypothetical protein
LRNPVTPIRAGSVANEKLGALGARVIWVRSLTRVVTERAQNRRTEVTNQCDGRSQESGHRALVVDRL